MSNLETYREKALECARAADGAHDSGERIGLLGLASVYMALADYVDHRHMQGTAERCDQGRGAAKSCHAPRVASGDDPERLAPPPQ